MWHIEKLRKIKWKKRESLDTELIMLTVGVRLYIQLMIKEGMSLKEKRGYMEDLEGRQKGRRNDIVYLHYNLKK